MLLQRQDNQLALHIGIFVAYKWEKSRICVYSIQNEDAVFESLARKPSYRTPRDGAHSVLPVLYASAVRIQNGSKPRISGINW